MDPPAAALSSPSSEDFDLGIEEFEEFGPPGLPPDHEPFLEGASAKIIELEKTIRLNRQPSKVIPAY